MWFVTTGWKNTIHSVWVMGLYKRKVSRMCNDWKSSVAQTFGLDVINFKEDERKTVPREICNEMEKTEGMSGQEKDRMWTKEIIKNK